MHEDIKRDLNDIYGMSFLGFIFKNKVFLTVLKIAVALLFFYAIFYGFLNQSKGNLFTRSIFWTLFWPFFMVVSLSTLGRLFCGVCPHAFLGKYITKFGLKKEMPSFLKNPFISLFLLVGLYWGAYYAYPSALKSVYATAMFFVVMTLLSVLTFFVFKEMSYCKYICPIGIVARGFGRVSSTWLSTYDEKCSTCKEFNCTKACSYALQPFNFDKRNSMGDCTLCMDCASACESVSFKLKKPSSSLFKPIPKPYKAEVWAYVLITSAITITMQFHHALGRCAVVLDSPWYQSAQFLKGFINFGSADAIGIMAFLYAMVVGVGLASGGMFIASKILHKKFDEVFYTLGYGFAPIFIIGGLSHLGEFFFVHYYSDIANGLNQAFGFGWDKIAPLASRGDSWVKVFKVFSYLGAFWSLWIIAKRMAFIEATKFKKIVAFPFAAALSLFFLGMIFYIPYAFKTYGPLIDACH